MLNTIRLLISTLILNKSVEKAAIPHETVWSLTDDKPARQCGDNPSHIDTSLDSELKPQLLNQRGWKIGKGVALLSQRGCGSQQKDAWHHAQGNVLAHTRPGSDEFWRLRLTLQGNIFLWRKAFDGTLGRSLEDGWHSSTPDWRWMGNAWLYVYR